MNIGSVTITGKAALAPMAGVADKAFRRICAGYGAAFSVSEMVSAKALSMGDKVSRKLMEPDEQARPYAIQLFGDDPAVMAIIERALADGCYINPEKKIANGIGSSHLHTAKALREELATGGFDTLAVHGVMGGAWLAPNLDALLHKEDTKALLLKTIRMLDAHEEIIGLSGHLLAVAGKG